MSRVLFWIFILILVSLLIRYWKGTTMVTATVLDRGGKFVATLQNPGGYPK